MPREGRRRWIIRRKSTQNTLGGLPGSAVRGREEVKSVIGTKELSQLEAGVMSLLVPLRCKLHPVIWYRLMNLAVLIAFRLGVSYQDDQLHTKVS